MAKLNTIVLDEDTSTVHITQTDLPPAPPSPRTKGTATKYKYPGRVPSSPHKPFTSSTFYDLTSGTPTKDFPGRAVSIDLTESPVNERIEDRALKLMNRNSDNFVRGPFAGKPDRRTEGESKFPFGIVPPEPPRKSTSLERLD
jgi:hypothetical protein